MIPAVLSSLRLLLALQVPQAGIEGVVRDERTGAALAGALVTLPDLGRAAVADERGGYVLTAVPAGPQHLAVRFLGYAPRTLHALVPTEGPLTIDVALRPEPLRLRTLEVHPPLAIRGLEQDSAAGADRAYSMAAIRNHPLLAEPDAIQGLGGGEVTLEPESPSGVHVRGAGSDQVAYLLDGIPVFSPYHSAGAFTGWNPDALAGISLSSIAPRPDAPEALAGIIAGETRSPGLRHGMQGSVGTTQARLTLDGPASAGAGYLLSLRSGFPGFPRPKDDPSYLTSESGDWLAKVEAPAFGGRLRLLGYGNENEIGAASGPDDTGSDLPRNRFEWGGRSVGVDWRREEHRLGIRAAAWSARSEAEAGWSSAGGRLGMAAHRSDWGAVLGLSRSAEAVHSEIGLRLERRATRYAVAGSGTSWSLDARTPEIALFAGHRRALARALTLDAAATLGTGAEGLRLLPRAVVVWRPARAWTVSASGVLLRQTEQSLRNPESVIGNVFPADLYIGSAAPGVPTARARQLVLAADYLAAPGFRVGAQAYTRRSHGLLLVAPRAGAPFASGGFTTGRGTASGLAVTAVGRSARVGFTASYALQRVRLRHGDSVYVPTYGTTHLAEAGVIVFPTATWSIRLGAIGSTGRRATAASGGLEWEACNIRDRGCELSGSPDYAGRPLGGARLPGYVRLDLGIRKHWHLRLAGRDAAVALFGTVTNLFGRRNLLTYVLDPATGEASPVEMRPFGPLVAGLDWQF